VATNQQAPSRGREAGPGRPKLAEVKPGVKPKVPPDPRFTPKEGKKGKGGKKLLLLVLVVLVAGGGFFAYRRLHPPAQGKAGVPVVLAGPQAIYTMQTLTVNLANVNSSHFLRIEVVLQYPRANTALAAELKHQEYILDDRIISDLRSKTYDELATDRGENALKKELMQTVNGILTKGRVTGVYFDQFLIQ
jgi:flagellar FliL protein